MNKQPRILQSFLKPAATAVGVFILSATVSLPGSAEAYSTRSSQIQPTQNSYTGVISKLSDKTFLIRSTEPASPIEIRALTVDANNTLLRLESGDFLEGSGEIISGALILKTVDFVGLASLLGTWRSGNDWVEFRDFYNATVSLSGEFYGSRKPIALQYSILSGENNSWKVLFSTQDNVVSASLTVVGDTCILRFDDQTYGPSQTYKLVKLNYANAMPH